MRERWFCKLFLILLLVQTVGCGDEGNCAVMCNSSAIVNFEPPLSGRDFVIRVGTDVLHCSSTMCVVSGGRIEVNVTPTQLTSVIVLNPLPGPFHLLVEADGAAAADKTFNYSPSDTYKVCGRTCYETVSYTFP